MLLPGTVSMIDAILAARKAKRAAQEAQRVSNELHRIEWWVGSARYFPPTITSCKSKPIPATSWKRFCAWAADRTTEQLLEQIRTMRAARGAK